MSNITEGACFELFTKKLFEQSLEKEFGKKITDTTKESIDR